MSRNLQSALGRLHRKLLARVRGVVRRGVLGNSVSTGAGQTLQTKLLAGDVADDVEHFEPFGFTSNPPPGAEGLVFAVGGERAHAVGINFGDRANRKAGLLPGEVALYHPSGSYVHLKNDGSIEVVPAPGQTVNLGGVPPAALAVARQTDPIAPTADLTAFIAATVTAITTMAAAFNVAPPGTPVVSLGAGAVAPPIPPPGFVGTIAQGGIGSTST